MTDDRELEAVLRRALAGEAERVQPSPDALWTIRRRTAARRDRFSWRVPVIALAGTAALLAAVFVAPTVLPPLDQGRGGTDSGGGAPAASSAAPVPSDTPIPGAGVNDLVTVWPYASRAEGYARAEQDVAAGRYPDLTQPDVAAVTFVESYVGASQALTARSAGRWKAGLRMRVDRDGTEVSLVHLVRVRVGNDAPYVVVDATGPGLGLTAAPGLDGAVTAGGLRNDPAAAPYVDLRAPGARTPLVATQVPGAAGGTEWSVELVPPGADRPRVRTDAVAAWTLDADGQVTAFAADSAAG